MRVTRRRVIFIDPASRLLFSPPTAERNSYQPTYSCIYWFVFLASTSRADAIATSSREKSNYFHWIGRVTPQTIGSPADKFWRQNWICLNLNSVSLCPIALTSVYLNLNLMLANEWIQWKCKPISSFLSKFIPRLTHCDTKMSATVVAASPVSRSINRTWRGPMCSRIPIGARQIPQTSAFWLCRPLWRKRNWNLSDTHQRRFSLNF